MPDQKPKLAEFLPYRLSITSNAISQRIALEYRMRFGLKIAEWRLMAVLGDSGPMTQRQLVGATFMDKVAVNRATKVLADRGLVSRQPNRLDGRSHLVGLTGEGMEIYDSIMPMARRFEMQLLDCLTAGERRALGRTLDKLFAQARDTDLEA